MKKVNQNESCPNVAAILRAQNIINFVKQNERSKK